MYLTKKDAQTPPEICADQIGRSLAADIVVIGGGHAGTQCALAAAEKGASVIVLEAKAADKMHWMGEQIGAFNSKYHIEHGFGPYDPDEIADEMYRCSSYLANPVLLRKYTHNCGEMVDNLLSLIPEDSTLLDPNQFDIQKAYGERKYPIERAGTKTWAATMIFRGKLITEREGPDFKYPFRGSNYQVNELSRLSEVEMLALKRSQALGADWQFGTKAVSLRQEEDGRVTGVIAQQGDTYIQCEARKAVVLCSGNFNRTGLDLGLSAGGHSEHMVEPTLPVPRVNNGMGGGPFLTLNARGKRFFNEANFYAMGFAIDRQPDGVVCTVMDANYMDTLITGGLQHGTPDFGRPEYLEQFREDMANVPAAGAEGYLVRDLNTSEREMFRFWAADTLEELAAYLGYAQEDIPAFVSSVERYNELCRTGKDTDFGKDTVCLHAIETPPFYGAKSMVDHLAKPFGPFGSVPGLMTDDYFNVVDDTRDPIGGLYALGNCLGARFGSYYPTPCGGIYIGTAMTHGRVLGKYLAEL